MRGSGQERAGEGDQLSLSCRKRDAALADLRLEAPGQAADEVAGADRVGRRLDLVVACIRSPERDVLAHGAREEESLLRHDPELAAQTARPEVPQVVAVDQHPATLRIVEARDQLREGRFAGARLTHQCQRLARRHLDRDVPQRPVVERPAPRRAARSFRSTVSTRRSDQVRRRTRPHPSRSRRGVAADPGRPGLSTMSGSVSSRSKILSSAAMPCW